MMKLNDAIGRTLVVLLDHLDSRGELEIQLTRARRYVERETDGSLSDIANEIRGSMPPAVWPSSEQLRAAVTKPYSNIYDDDGERHDQPPDMSGTIIEQVTECLLHPFARNILAWETLATLQGALLDDEQRTLGALTPVCSNCATPFMDQEMITLGERTLYCVKCRRPRQVPCEHYNCREAVEVPRLRCAAHQQEDRRLDQLFTTHTVAYTNTAPTEEP